jgi:hypothetical protein
MIASQLSFRSPLPHVIGHKDYHEKKLLFETIDDLIARSRLDEIFIDYALIQRDRLCKEIFAEKLRCNPSELDDIDFSTTDFMRQRFIDHSRVAFRCCIIRFLDGNCSARKLSNQLAENHLVQWFCLVENFGVVRPPSKSTIDRYFRWISSDDLDRLTQILVRCAGSKPESSDDRQILGLESEIVLTDLWIDNTCLKANIHFPVDWVLLGDGVRTLMKATTLIRTKGELKNRMPQDPSDFISDINSLAIAMSQLRRQPDSKKNRKAIFRKMKKLEAKVRGHAIKHMELLRDRWEETPWSQKQAERIIERMQKVLDQLPAAVKQAHERIIGERQVKSSEKILSLYEPDTRVIVRGKSGAEVEFGNVLAIGEQVDGLIVSWDLYKENIVDCKTVIPSVLQAQEVCGNTIKAVYGDRGTSSTANSDRLSEMGIADCLGPRRIEAFQERMQDAQFAGGQKRRAQTEGRISILKNRFLGRPLRMKGFENRRQALSWAVLSHNLWVLARLRIEQEQEAKRRREEEEAKKAA